MRYFRGFTLVELMVAITIIAVLLALLAPAMDKAIYQAELATCMTRIRAIGQGATTYAADQRRSYPLRRSAQPGVGSVDRIIPGATTDDRPMLRPYFSVRKALLCPLAPTQKIDFEAVTAGNIFTTNLMWFGFTYSGEAHGMRKIGDRMDFNGWRLNLLASDHDMTIQGQGRHYSGHPDSEGALQPAWSQQDNYFFQRLYKDPNSGIPDLNGTYTFSLWLGPNGVPTQTGTVDMNFGYQDGSVARTQRIKWLDTRMVQASYYTQKSVARILQVPIEAANR